VTLPSLATKPDDGVVFTASAVVNRAAARLV
jgi:hypothetical protein